MSKQRQLALGGRERRFSRLAGIVALLSIGAWPVVALARLLGHRNTVTSPVGDQALLELGARQALHLEQLVGPYSRFGWHHPGPALFYLMALPTWLFGSGPGINVATALINGAAVVAAVAYVGRRWGGMAALWSAAAEACLCLALSFFPILYPWNPDVLVLPLVTFALLWADAVRGRLAPLAWTAVLGSFLVQTHISTGPFVVIMTGAAALGAVVVRRRRRAAQERMDPFGVAAGAGVVLLVASLIAPVVELFRDHPNNLTLLYRYFVHSPEPRVSVISALHQSTNALTLLPFGGASLPNGIYVDHGAVKVALTAVVMGVIAAAGLVVARRRGQVGAQLIIVTALAGAVIGVVATTRITGAIISYLVEWQAFVPCALLIGFGCALFGTEVSADPAVSAGPDDAGPAAVTAGRRFPSQSLMRALVVALGSVAVGLGATLVHYQFKQVALVGADSPVAHALATAADRAVPPGKQTISVDIVDDAAWPYASTVVLALEREGHSTTVSPNKWVSTFGRQYAAGRPTAMTLALFEATDAQTPPGRVVGQAGGITEVVRSSA